VPATCSRDTEAATVRFTSGDVSNKRIEVSTRWHPHW